MEKIWCNGNLTNCWWEDKLVQAQWVAGILKSLSEIYSLKKFRDLNTWRCVENMFVASLFLIAKWYKRSKCPPAEQRTITFQYIHTRKHSNSVKRGTIATHFDNDKSQKHKAEWKKKSLRWIYSWWFHFHKSNNKNSKANIYCLETHICGKAKK